MRALELLSKLVHAPEEAETLNSINPIVELDVGNEKTLVKTLIQSVQAEMRSNGKVIISIKGY